MTSEVPVTAIKGIGESVANKLAKLEVKSIDDLINFFPRRYNDYSNVLPISKIRPGPVTIKAHIKQISGRYVRRGMHITEAVASDETDSVRLVWFNQPYRAKNTKAEADYFISGEFQLSRQRLLIMNPSMELASDFPVNTARIVPVYRETKGLKSFSIRKAIREVIPMLHKMHETLPNWVVNQNKLLPHGEAIEIMHFPNNSDDIEEARRRLGFEEVFHLSVASELNRQENAKEQSLEIPFDEKLAKDFVKHLPFKLTDAQRRVIWRIYQDLQSERPSNRLIEGDVGSGKTVVAAMAAVMAMKHGFQVALMAPTELLARQHANTIRNLLKPLGYEKQVSLLIGSMKPAEKKKIYASAKASKIKFLVGTHALIQEKVDMHNLALVIIDEQHRFGVDQRKKLLAKAGVAPHTLSMTATPIPRSLALTLYGELDISVIDAMPHGRKAVKTEICSPNSRAQLYKKIDKELEAGRQMFVVCPLIEDSEVSQSLSAQTVHLGLSKKYFPHRKVGLLHGRMKADEKEKVMADFVKGKYDILVATTVIEVGVHVPNATVMLIEDAERFGLAQIHQLRGRVGRAEHQGYCYLMPGDSSAPSRRLQALESMNDGFKLAELDLQLRGPGAIYGHTQHGQLDLRVAKLTDTKLIAAAREAAKEFCAKSEDLLEYPQAYKAVNKYRSVTNLN